jgi:hypothetical protein
MAATEVFGRSFSDALYERYCDFDSTFDDLKNGCDIVFFVGSSPKKTGTINTNELIKSNYFNIRIGSCSQCINCCLNR